jgi:hypothetical protein
MALVKSSVGKAAYAAAAIAALSAVASAPPASAQQPTPIAATASTSTPQSAEKPFTKEECKGILAVAGRYVAGNGAETISADFRQSFLSWVGNLTCDGPRDIIIRTGRDSDVFNAIRSSLDAGTARIDLVKRAGLRIARPTAGLGSGG